MVIADLYISVDIEADGPIPGPYSMLSFGLAVVGRFDGVEFQPSNPSANTFYRELRPISDNFDPKALEVARLDREKLKKSGALPQVAMEEARQWLEEVSGRDRPALVGFPLLFDWLFFYWYLRRFTRTLPLTFSSGLDMKTMYQQKARVPLELAGKEDLPSHLKSSNPHTHNALEDAIEQGDIFIKLFNWQGKD